MTTEYTNDYLLDKKVKIFQPINGYRASTDAVLLAAAVDESKTANAQILDVGSGTGAISLCLAQRLQQNNVRIVGLEIQSELSELADLSAKENNFSFVKFYNEDIRKKINNENVLPCSFDVVISNPPYSDHDMPSPNESKAAAHNHQDFDLSRWLAFCLKMAKPFGRIYLINRVEALPEICTFFQGKAGGMLIRPLYSKKGQEAKRIIVSVQKDSKAPCRILPPFVVHNAVGTYTDEAQQILRQGSGFADFK
ncbi:MAG: methyltransferase domain-containing protein [Alphaproteobacteria bacterium]|nr:methyltransferase domain-containing protein [Alphaproteobacteria bacterium]